jgi:heat shock protein HtpX
MSTTKRSNFAAGLRTTILLATLTGIFVVIGFAIGGAQTAFLFLAIGALFNLGAYWFSDKIALKMSGAKPISEQEAPRLYQMVRELTTRAGLPMPSLHLIPQAQPNAFATGRSPDKSAVAVTQGILQLLSEDELRGVIAHELAHIRNRDVLIQSVAATIGGAITYIAYTLMWFGGDDESPLGLVGSLAMVILAPLAATIVQLAISRQREYSADATGADICGNPESLASALLRLEEGAKAVPDARQPGRGAALHREADPRRVRRPVQHAPPDRGARAPAAADAPDHRLSERRSMVQKRRPPGRRFDVDGPLFARCRPAAIAPTRPSSSRAACGRWMSTAIPTGPTRRAERRRSARCWSCLETTGRSRASASWTSAAAPAACCVTS